MEEMKLVSSARDFYRTTGHAVLKFFEPEEYKMICVVLNKIVQDFGNKGKSKTKANYKGVLSQKTYSVLKISHSSILPFELH